MPSGRGPRSARLRQQAFTSVNEKQFWKGFFEASANVKLSSYEEGPEDTEEETLEEETQTLHGQDYGTPNNQTNQNDTTITTDDRPTSRFDADLEGSSPAGSAYDHNQDEDQDTPRMPSTKHSPLKATTNDEASFLEYPSPYETLRQEMTTTGTTRTKHPSRAPTTPGRPNLAPALTPLPESSPFLPSNRQQTTRPRNQDPLLYRVLDKNYRIQATPLTSRKKVIPPPSTVAQDTNANLTRVLDFSSPFSPPVAAPQLRSEIFGSPSRGAPRTPGISVQKAKGRTPRLAFGARGGAGDGNLFSPQRQGAAPIVAARATKNNTTNIWDSDSEDGDDGQGGNTLDELGMSPPKTMQFHIPASRLMQTPAREASKRIVEDLLMTAGVGNETSTLDDLRLSERGEEGYGRGWEDEDEGMGLGGLEEDDSPSVVRVARRDADADAF